MKKTIIVPFMLLASIAFGQLSLGIKGGVNISNFNGDVSNVNKSSITAWHAGGLVYLPIAHHLVLQPEVLYSEQGAKLEHNGNEHEFKIGYINIPIMLQYEMSGGFYIEAGPQFGFRTHEDLPDSIKTDFAKSTDFAGALGLGYHFKGKFGIGARYVLGFGKVSDFEINNVSPDYKNAVWQFSLYIIFHTRKSEKSNQQ